MAELSELELLRDLSVARAARIVELERQLLRAGDLHQHAASVLRDVLDGAGASLEERMRASVAMAEVAAQLVPLVRPAPQAEPRIPGRVIDLGVRFARPRAAYEGSFYERVRMSATPSATDDTEKKG